MRDQKHTTGQVSEGFSTDDGAVIQLCGLQLPAGRSAPHVWRGAAGQQDHGRVHGSKPELHDGHEPTAESDRDSSTP